MYIYSICSGCSITYSVYKAIASNAPVLLKQVVNAGVRVQVKCDQYWPTRGSESYGFVHVTTVDVVDLATYTIRTFQLVMVRDPNCSITWFWGYSYACRNCIKIRPELLE